MVWVIKTISISYLSVLENEQAVRKYSRICNLLNAQILQKNIASICGASEKKIRTIMGVKN